jgi:hypothetical protein
MGTGMNPETSPQFFRYEQPLTAAAIGDPAMTVVKTGAHITLLLAQRVHQEALPARLLLQAVICMEGMASWEFREIPVVALHACEGSWLAEDAANQTSLAPPRPAAFKVVFISKADHERLQKYALANRPWPIVQFAQRFFPELPAFSTVPSTTPETNIRSKFAYYEEFQREREEIMKHKWRESEKAGYDIGFERALADWVVKHRAKWRQSRGFPPK